jgi:hypothetical protein
MFGGYQAKTDMLYWLVYGRSWIKFQAKNKDYKIDIGYNSANIAVVKTIITDSFNMPG